MADDQKKLEFLLTTKAELAGAMQMEESLQRQIGQAKALGKDYSELDKQLALVRGTIDKSVNSNEELKKAQTESAKASEFLHENHKKLHALFHMMGEGTLPMLGGAFLKTFTGPLGAVLALAGVVQTVKGKLEETNAELDKMAEESAKPMGAGVEGFKTHIDNARTALGEFLAALATAGKDADPIKTQTDRVKELVTAEIEGQKKIIEALQQTEIARLRANDASPEQIAAAEARHKVTLDHLDARINGMRGLTGLLVEQAEREKEAVNLVAEAEAKRFKANEARTKLDTDKTAIGILRKQLGIGGTDATYDNEEKTLNENAALIEKRKQQLEIARKGGNNGLIPVLEKDIATAEEEIGTITGRRNQRRQRLDQLEGQLAGRSKTAAETDIEAGLAESAAKTNESRRRQLPGEIEQAGKVSTINDQTNRVVEILNAHGGKNNQSLAELAQTAGYSADQTKLLADKIAAGITRMVDAFAALDKRIAQVEAKTNLP